MCSMKMNVAVIVIVTLAIGSQGSDFLNSKPLEGGAALDGRKPTRGFRDIQKRYQENEDKKHNASHQASTLGCGVTSQVNSGTDKYELCPTSCPYFAQNREDSDHCTFLCVEADSCAQWNPNKPIADTAKRSRTCRGPRVDFCTDLSLDGTDSCLKCETFFSVNPATGQCVFDAWIALGVAVTIAVVLVVIAIVWVVDICCRKTTNQKGLDDALKFRSRSKILQPKDEEGKRHTYPMSTNMCSNSDVAGPGMTLHFTFQAFLIMWPAFVAIVWSVLACFHEELWILGTRKFGTPRHNCILVAWGYETQQGLMWTKVLFLVIVYIVTFISLLLFAVFQHRLYRKLDARSQTMKDFAVELKGLPPLPADQRSVELDIKREVEKAVNKEVVGVSVAWNFTDKEDDVMEKVQANQTIQGLAYDAVHDGPGEDEADESHSPRFGKKLRSGMESWEKWVLCPDDDAQEKRKSLEDKVHSWEQEKRQLPGAGDAKKDEIKKKLVEELEKQLSDRAGEGMKNDVVKMLGDIRSSGSAFVVFKTEADKEDAIALMKSKGGLAFKDSTLTFEEAPLEPATLNWQNFGESGFSAMASKFVKAFFTYYVPAMLIWFFVFYLPYAHSVSNFNYENGAEPPWYYGLAFTMVVVGGNATMYIVCDLCAEAIGFRSKDTKQCVYLVFYLFACSFNVFLDMWFTWRMAWKVMTGLDFRTYSGLRLDKVETFTEAFETYAMQRSLAENTFSYAFPSTFLVPFLLEPIVTITAPYLVGRLLIRTNREIKGSCAEAYIAAFDADLGRYADLILNVFLGILIFYFPGGYTWTLFRGMCISHIWIYLFDHTRVLKVIPALKVSDNSVDWFAQLCLIPCCAIILSCLVFKANCESYVGYCLKGDMSIVGVTTLAGLAHFVVHTALFVYLVPVLGDMGDVQKCEAREYKDIAKEEPRTWFSLNPVHCLRSQYIENDWPYCRFSSVGKDHLLVVNEKIGCYFSDLAATSEDFSLMAAKRDLVRMSSKTDL